jgi:6-phospho-beta-glucosidase
VNHYNDLNKHPEKVREEKFNRSRETAADIISSHFEGKVFIDVGNCINTGQISNLPFGAVVETAVQVDRTGFSPINYGDLAEPLCGFIEPFCRTFTLTVDACFQKDKHLAIQALRLDPVCSHLNNDQVMDLGSRLLKAHEKYITCFKV